MHGFFNFLNILFAFLKIKKIVKFNFFVKIQFFKLEI